MFKIWYKSIFTTFIIIFLLCNLLMFDNMLSTMSNGYAMFNRDYTNSYFGFSTLYDFFSGGFVEDSSLLMDYYNFLNNQLNAGSLLLYRNWKSFADSGGIYNISTFFTAVGNFFGSIFSIFIYITYPLLYFIYIICLFIWSLLKVMSLVQGGFFTPMPSFTYS